MQKYFLELHNLKKNIEKTVASLFILMLAVRFDLTRSFERTTQIARFPQAGQLLGNPVCLLVLES
jgi:hypothetical protein